MRVQRLFGPRARGEAGEAGGGGWALVQRGIAVETEMVR